MGNDSSFLKKYNIQPEPFFVSKLWSIHHCSYSLKKMNLFVLNDSDHSFDIYNWKSIRHPFILKYYDDGVFNGKKCIVTEPVEPLVTYVEKMMIDEVISGLNNICVALKFLHETCILSHNFLNLDSIFISLTNYSWKLGCLQFSTVFGGETNEQMDKLFKFQQIFAPRITTPEDLILGTIEPITKTVEIHRRDVYALGLLLEDLLKNHNIDISNCISYLTNCNPKLRPKVSQVLENPLFTDCDFLKITSILTNFASLIEIDKKSFLTTLVNRMQNLPPELIASKLAPLMLTNRFVISHPSANETVLPYLFTCTSNERIQNPLIDEELFKVFVMPVILKLFCVRNIQVRLILLEYLPYYVCFIQPDSLKKILPQILLGMKDENDHLVSATLIGLSHLVDTFGASNILGERSKLFTSVTPKLNIFPREITLRNELDVFESLDTNLKVSGDVKAINENNLKDESIVENDKQDKIKNREVASMKINIDKSSVKSDKGKSQIKESRFGKAKLDFVDIRSIDFKISNDDEIDLFSGMEPNFKFNINHIPKTFDSSKFEMLHIDESEIGWNEEAWNDEAQI